MRLRPKWQPTVSNTTENARRKKHEGFQTQHAELMEMWIEPEIFTSSTYRYQFPIEMEVDFLERLRQRTLNLGYQDPRRVKNEAVNYELWHQAKILILNVESLFHFTGRLSESRFFRLTHTHFFSLPVKKHIEELLSGEDEVLWGRGGLWIDF